MNNPDPYSQESTIDNNHNSSQDEQQNNVENVGQKHSYGVFLEEDKGEEKEGDFAPSVDQKEREEVIDKIFPVLNKTTYLVYLLVFGGLVIDTFGLFLGYIESGERLINDKVVMALIGATAVKIGASAYIIAKNIFHIK